MSALFAGSAVTLGMLGGMSQVQQDSFQFSRGTSFVAGEHERLRGYLAKALPDERIHIVALGHTGTSGDATANLELSEARAELVTDLTNELGIPKNRVTVKGVGGASPLPQKEGETDRAHQLRLARVEISLQVRR
ncbi:MAG: OmpA family protein [Pseudomonadota bacterium]